MCHSRAAAASHVSHHNATIPNLLWACIRHSFVSTELAVHTVLALAFVAHGRQQASTFGLFSKVVARWHGDLSALMGSWGCSSCSSIKPSARGQRSETRTGQFPHVFSPTLPHYQRGLPARSRRKLGRRPFEAAASGFGVQTCNAL